MLKNALLLLSLFAVTSCRAGTAGRSATVPALQTNDFAFKLYDQLKTAEGNLFFSPASIEAALAMTAEGAKKQTLAQFKNLMPQRSCFPDIGKSVTFENANAIWVNQMFPILGNFQSAVTEKFGAEIRSADFARDPNAERVKINQWVEEKTRDKIPNLLPEGSVNAMTRMILVNAIYFNGDWLHAFDPAQTSDALFQTLESGSVEVPMMQLSGKRFNYGENDCFQTLELPYEGGEVSMLVFLPRKAAEETDLKTMLAVLDETPLRKREVDVFLPRFKVESTFASLKRNLAALGLTDAFDPERADFSGISELPLFISDVVHKAFVEVNEEGTEAAAATGIIMRTTAMPAPPATFRADHPFVFLIRENESGKILFTGRVCDPSK